MAVAIRLAGELALAGDPGVAAQALVEQAGPDRIGGLVDEPDGRLDVRHGARRLVEAGDAGERRRAARPGRGRPAPRRRGRGPTGRSPARTAPAPRGRRSGPRRRRPPRPTPRRRAAGRARRTSGRRAPRHATASPRGARLERPREGRVQPGPLAGQQVVVDRLLEQRVPEGIALDAGRRVRDEDLATDALAERVVERRLVERGGRREQRRVDALAGRRGDAQELLGRLGEVGRPGQEHVAQRRRAARPGRPRRPRRAAPRRRTRCRRTAGVDRLDERRRRGRGRRSPGAAAADSRRSNGASASRSTRPVRSSSARNGSSGWRRWSSSER